MAQHQRQQITLEEITGLTGRRGRGNGISLVFCIFGGLSYPKNGIVKLIVVLVVLKRNTFILQLKTAPFVSVSVIAKS